MAVIKDVAELAGLSVSAVSKYLNHPDKVKADTKERIEAAIKQLNYTPSSAARSIKSKRSGMIAIVVPDIRDEFYAELFGYMKAYAFEKGYMSILFTTENDTATIQSYLSKVSLGDFDGIIPCFINEVDVFEKFSHKNKEFPMVLITGLFEDYPYSTVAIDLYKGMYIATRHLIDQGYKKIAFIGGTKGGRITGSKFEGYSDALKEAGMKIQENYLKYGKSRFKEGYLGAESCLSLKDKPDAVIASNDSVAAGFIKYASGHGYKVPQDIGVVGFNNTPLASIYEPGITTISIPVRDMCEAAVDMLIAKIEKKQDVRKTVVFDTAFIPRKSTDKAGKLRENRNIY